MRLVCASVVRFGEISLAFMSYHCIAKVLFANFRHPAWWHWVIPLRVLRRRFLLHARRAHALPAPSVGEVAEAEERKMLWWRVATTFYVLMCEQICSLLCNIRNELLPQINCLDIEYSLHSVNSIFISSAFHANVIHANVWQSSVWSITP